MNINVLIFVFFVLSSCPLWLKSLEKYGISKLRLATNNTAVVLQGGGSTIATTGC
jgi:hypothetical protein